MKHIFVLCSSFFVLFISCTKIDDDEGSTVVTGKWQLTSYEVVVEPSSMYNDVMAVFYPEGLPAAQENTGYIFSGRFYRIFDAQGETARFRYEIKDDTLTFINAPAGITGIDREVIFRLTNNDLRLGNSIFDKEIHFLYKNFQSEWDYINSIDWRENEESTAMYHKLVALREEGEAIISLFEKGLEQVYFYALFNKR